MEFTITINFRKIPSGQRIGVFRQTDIVETGSTLRENGLGVLEEVMPLSARMVVNQVSMKMESERITKLIQDLRAAL